MEIVSSREKVAAIIVTYVREKEVMAMLETILAQSRPPDEVIIIDNSPTTAIGDIIHQKFPQVYYQHLEENKGPAGGFYEGLKLAYERNYKWFWTFDDDCRPAGPKCLQSLLAHRNDNITPSVIIPLVQDPITKAFLGNAGLWSGSLFNYDVIKTVGFPKKDLFFGSEDLEYERRIREKGLLILKSRCKETSVIHPMRSKRSFYSLIKRGYDEPTWRIYYTIRGSTWLKIQKSRIKGPFLALYPTLRTFVAIVFSRDKCFDKYRMVFKGFLDGLFGKLGKRVEIKETNYR